VNWNQDSSELPNWDIAEQWMAEQEKICIVEMFLKAHLRNGEVFKEW